MNRLHTREKIPRTVVPTFPEGFRVVTVTFPSLLETPRNVGVHPETRPPLISSTPDTETTDSPFPTRPPFNSLLHWDVPPEHDPKSFDCGTRPMSSYGRLNNLMFPVDELSPSKRKPFWVHFVQFQYKRLVLCAIMVGVLCPQFSDHQFLYPKPQSIWTPI